MKYIFILLYISVLMSCSGKAEDTETDDESTEAAAVVGDQITLTDAQVKAINLEIGVAQTTTITDEIKVNGVVDVPPQYMASVSVPMGGIVKSIAILPGQRVGKGQTLITVQSLEFIQMQQDYLQAVAQQTFQQQELTRQQTLSNEDVGARKRLQQAQADVAGTQALMSSLALKLRTLGVSATALRPGTLSPVIRVSSPISGYVTTVNVHLGQQIAPTDALFDVVNKEHMHLELKVFEADAMRVKIGQTILLNDPKLGSQTLRGTVFLVGKAFDDTAERTINVHGHVADERQEARLIPGMYLSARILTGARPATTLPEGAVVRQSKDGFVFAQTAPNTFRRIPVKLGTAENGRLEISGLMPKGTGRLVLKGAYLLQAEMAKAEGGGEEE
jgi:membrane fusion protein, heavy metal efflux system